MALNVELSAVSNGEVDLSRGNFGQQVSDFDVSVFCPGQLRIQLLQGNEHVGVARSGDDLD